MTQPTGVAEAIGAQPVEPEATNPTAAESLNGMDETLKAMLAKKDDEFNQLKSVKDKETSAEKRARQEAEKRAEQAEARAAAVEAQLAQATDQHWQTFQKYAPKEDVEQALTAYQQEAAQRQQATVQRERWNAWKWETLASMGVPPAEIKAATSKTAVDALITKYREEQLVASKTAEIEQAIIEKLTKSGVIAPNTPAPKTPLDVKSEPSAPKKKATAEDVEAARQAFALRPRNNAAREAYEKATADFASKQ